MTEGGNKTLLFSIFISENVAVLERVFGSFCSTEFPSFIKTHFVERHHTVIKFTTINVIFDVIIIIINVIIIITVIFILTVIFIITFKICCLRGYAWSRCILCDEELWSLLH